MTRIFSSKQVVRITLFLIVIFLGLAFQYKRGKILGTYVEAVGSLIITYNSLPLGPPIFSSTDFKPGDCNIQTVDVENNGNGNAVVGVFSVNEVDSSSMAAVLTIKITDLPSTVVYPESSLSDFIADSGVLNQIVLSTLPEGESTSYKFEICFPEEAGNEFQSKTLSFDLKFGEITPPIALPPVCADLEGIVTEVIVGTSGSDNINGTTASELIRGLGGNDRIRGGGGDDCIIGGPGNDRIDGGSGNDTITGNQGNDRIRGGSGKDVITAGIGNDRVNSGSGDDIVFGNSGNDRLSGSTGDDVIRGGTGNDNIRGGSGEDKLYGQAGNDNIRGGSNNDLLHGGADTDILNGNSGIDTCLAGETEISCEP